MQIDMKKLCVKWKPGMLFWGLISYVADCGLLGVLADYGSKGEMIFRWKSLIILLMLIYIILCMSTMDIYWSVWKRIGFVILGWLLLQPIIALITGLLLTQIVSINLADLFSCFLGSLPVVLFAMHKSRLFTYQDSEC